VHPRHTDTNETFGTKKARERFPLRDTRDGVEVKILSTTSNTSCCEKPFEDCRLDINLLVSRSASLETLSSRPDSS